MYQQEIVFFWPLTEQIPLDLDYTDCDKPKLWSATTEGTFMLVDSTLGVPNSIQFRPESESAGYWELGEGFHFYNKTKPNWLHQKMVAAFLGLKWKDK